MSITFDWHEEDRKHGGSPSFLAWVFLATATKEKIKDDEWLEQMRELTDDFTHVVFTMQVNGVEVDADKLLDRIKDSMDSAVEYEARRMLEDLPGYSEVTDAIDELSTLLTEQLEQAQRRLRGELESRSPS